MYRYIKFSSIVEAHKFYSTESRISRFVDSIRIKFIGGNGGDGCISFLHLFANEFAGPDGGNGGNGGHVILKANKHIKSLNHLHSSYVGKHGHPGSGKNMYGRAGEHRYVDVPVGTTIRSVRRKNIYDSDHRSDESDIVAELDEDGSMFIAARGGVGGKGNMSYLTNKNRHPRQAEVGGKGESSAYEVRMRLYAHMGLVGLPNVGKSTLLQTLTNANVKIGEYAFTTLHPQVGTLEFEDYSQIAISDLPGLIEDSYKNRGLGIQFLRHVERCCCLVYVVDMSSEKPASDQLEQVVHEIEAYKKGLKLKPSTLR